MFVFSAHCKQAGSVTIVVVTSLGHEKAVNKLSNTKWTSGNAEPACTKPTKETERLRVSFKSN